MCGSWCLLRFFSIIWIFGLFFDYFVFDKVLIQGYSQKLIKANKKVASLLHSTFPKGSSNVIIASKFANPYPPSFLASIQSISTGSKNHKIIDLNFLNCWTWRLRKVDVFFIQFFHWNTQMKKYYFRCSIRNVHNWFVAGDVFRRER